MKNLACSMIKLKVKGSKIDDLCGAPISLKTNQEKFPRKVATFTLRTNYHKTCRFRLNEHLVFSVHSQVEEKKPESGQYNSELEESIFFLKLSREFEN